jgi:hypothetical protein
MSTDTPGSHSGPSPAPSEPPPKRPFQGSESEKHSKCLCTLLEDGVVTPDWDQPENTVPELVYQFYRRFGIPPAEQAVRRTVDLLRQIRTLQTRGVPAELLKSAASQKLKPPNPPLPSGPKLSPVPAAKPGPPLAGKGKAAAKGVTHGDPPCKSLSPEAATPKEKDLLESGLSQSS